MDCVGKPGHTRFMPLNPTKRSLRERAALWAYGCAMTLAQPFLVRKLQKRAVAEPMYGELVEQRFGEYGDVLAAPPEANGAYVWVHAVSLGETRGAVALIAQLRQVLPGMRLLLTHGTATGRAQGQSLLQAGDVQVWQPWDSPQAVQRFLSHFRPRVGLLMETEVWPNMVNACAKAGIPLCVVNARLNEKSHKQARRLAWLARPAYRALAAVWAQSADDACRLESLGAPVRGVMGNFKYDATPDAGLLARGIAWRAGHKPVLMFASAREGEERMLLDVLEGKLPSAPMGSAQTAITTVANAWRRLGVQLLVVPRHPQRFDEVAQMFMSAGLCVSRRSTWADAPQDADVWLGDSVGEMALYFGLAQAALLGGSFAPLGGQNLIEAAACACPVIMGPHTFNFAEAALVSEAAGSAIRAKDMADAIRQATALLHSPTELQRSTEAARALCQAHRGAAAKTAAAIQTLLLG